ncbi:MAG TPA: hypothetical protein VHJ82_10235 [Actinomycetota bacterium]|nr:hypothetical protein [Actinomycetota bacterium]
MGDYRVLRVGGLVAMIGAVLAVVLNLLHPRTSNPTLEEELDLASSRGIWMLDHFGLLLIGGFFLFSGWAIARSFRTEPSRSWAGVALAFAIAGAAALMLVVAIDGYATNAVADEWAATGGSEASLAAARAVSAIGVALFTAMIALTFGLTPILFGVTILAGAEYSRGLGWLAIFSGVVGLVTATIQYFGGLTNLTLNVLFPISSIGLTIWLFVMGWRLYQRTGTEELMAPVEVAVRS